MTMKAPLGGAELFLATGEPFFYPACVDANGWTGVRVGVGASAGVGTDWEEIAEPAEDLFGSAPKNLIADFDTRVAEGS